MPKLVFAPSARADLSDIFDFIARDKPIAASKWVDTIEEKCELIASTPGFGELRPEYGADIRSRVIGRYVIFYRSIDDGIEIVLVIPGDRDIRSL
jgi:toxin ParE1/3/4